jgi:hypothetical protein
MRWNDEKEMKEPRLTRNSRCSLVSANRTEIRLPGSFHPRTIRPCSRSMISSAAARVSSLCGFDFKLSCLEGKRESTYRTNAIILGGLLSLVWKKRLLRMA